MCASAFPNWATGFGQCSKKYYSKYLYMIYARIDIRMAFDINSCRGRKCCDYPSGIAGGCHAIWPFLHGVSPFMIDVLMFYIFKPLHRID